MAGRSPGPASPAPDEVRSTHGLELAIARLLNLGAMVSVALLAAGVLLLVLAGRSPLDPVDHAVDFGRIPADLVALRPEGFLWLGLLAVIATPTSRVIASLLGFAVARDRTMALVSAGVLAVIAVGVILSVSQA